MANVTRLTDENLENLTSATQTVDGVISIIECLMNKVIREGGEVTVSELSVLHDSLVSANSQVISVFTRELKAAVTEEVKAERKA